MDKIFSEIVALGIPGLATYFGMQIVSCHGPAAFNKVMKTVGCGNMYRGMTFTVAGSFLIYHLLELGLTKLAVRIIRERVAEGEEVSVVLESIEKMPISKELKAQLRNEVYQVSVTEDGRMDAVTAKG